MIPEISILIPTYNSESTITRTIDSILSQDYDMQKVQVVIVDDCSTDETWYILKKYREVYPENLEIFQLDKNSGSPSIPRNKAMTLAKGEYILFVDSDDWLGQHALIKMLTHAKEWESDVLLLKLKGENDRVVPKSMFDKNQKKVDIFTSKVMWSFSPLKLFRHNLIADNNLIFPSFMPEDITFVLKAYLLAKTVSVAADYDYYHVSYNDPTNHLSTRTWSNSESNLLFIQEILEIINQYNITYKQASYALLKRIFRRDILQMLLFSVQMDRNSGKEYFDSIKTLTKKFYKRKMYETCPLRERILLDVAYKRCYHDFKQVSTLEKDLLNRCSWFKIGTHILCRLPRYACNLTIDVTHTNDKSYLDHLAKKRV